MLATPKASFDKLAWLGAFDTFMTTPDSHNDVYASTYIRMFFANRAQGKELLQSADNDGHNTDAIDALTLVGVVTVSALANGDDVHAKVTDYITSARRSSALPGYCHIYADMLVRLLTRDLSEASPADALRQAAVAAGQQLGVDVAAMAQREYARSDPMTACYIASAFPALLVFAYKYASDPVACLLASANAGGENVARGGALGALVGAAHGGDPAGVWTAPSWVKADLKDAEVIESEINAALDGMGV
jgi:ADP-ribosylglycohydrolase